MAEVSVGQLACRAGVSVATLHFYEQKGLIQSHRNAGNQRRYNRRMLRRVAVIKTAQRLGFSLREIADMLSELGDQQDITKDNWQRLSQQWHQALTERIDSLQRLRDELNTCIGCGCLSMDNCQLRNPDDALGEQGPGPVLWERKDS
ncbi:redox-sensitive transcriptional activator SoxR [Saccharospirillum impatiens]|uniref:redox-sensitive transcriptional activator SoxR n=1 Tax=Saccharospirillum impatiens TaxID=169438 RepID=UPI00041E371C|nr:redox-sensitive transcriptional activator SoxR [Saccharospirillum impatiens]